jgi:hypothetical protein
MVMARTLLGVVVVVVMGCGSSVETSEEEEFAISVETGGGFVGLYEGCRLRSSGAAQRWRRVGAGTEQVLWSGDVSVETAAGWRDRLAESGALQMVDGRTGNMTTRVTYARGDTTLNWSWAVRAGEEDGQMQTLRQWQMEFAGFCRNLGEE